MGRGMEHQLPAAEIFIRSSLRFVKNLFKNTKFCQEHMRQVEKSVSTTFSTPLKKSTPPVAHVEPPDKPPTTSYSNALPGRTYDTKPFGREAGNRETF